MGTKVGIICDLSYTRHHLFKSYYWAVSNLYGIPVVVNSIDDLKGVQLLFIGDDHYGPHKQVWQSKDFIAYCNINGIKVVVLTNETILRTYFPWNLVDLKKLNKFKCLYHYANDVDDCAELGLLLNRTAPSIHFKPDFDCAFQKKDKVVFIGKTECPKNSYQSRKNLLKTISKVIDIDVFDSTIPDWYEYVKLIAGYKYILSPLGNGNFFPMRFYEALAVGSIPIHQVRENTLRAYDIEHAGLNALFFKTIEDLPKLSPSFTPEPIWMEDTLKLNLIKDKLYDAEGQ